eukprot:6183173-Pleurochrysis_carterae.AAC.2
MQAARTCTSLSATARAASTAAAGRAALAGHARFCLAGIQAKHMPGSSLGSRCVSSVSSTLPPGAADSLFGEAVQLPSIDAQSLVSHADAAQLEEDGAIVLRDAFPSTTTLPSPPLRVVPQSHIA